MDDHARIGHLERSMDECRAHVHARQGEMANDIKALHQRVDQLSADVHRITIAVGDISHSLRDIATAVSRLSDLPETWEKLKGFWAVVSWFRANVVSVATLVVLTILLLLNTNVAEILKGLLP